LRAALLEWSITSLAQQLILLQFFSLKWTSNFFAFQNAWMQLPK
jgi:hypothetical protein